MNKSLWLAFTGIFFVFAVFHFYRATKSLPKAQNTATIKTINGQNLGIHEFIQDFNRYIDGVNKEAKIANVITGVAHLVAAATALFSYFT